MKELGRETSQKHSWTSEDKRKQEDPILHEEELWKASVKTWDRIAGMRWNSEQKTVKDEKSCMAALCSTNQGHY